MGAKRPKTLGLVYIEQNKIELFKKKIRFFKTQIGIIISQICGRSAGPEIVVICSNT